MEDYIIYDINKKIQQDVCAFGIQGGFIFILMAWLIICFVALMALKSYIGVIFASLLALIFFLIAYGISSYLSKKYGIKGIMTKIGSHRQPSKIFCLRMNFKIQCDGHNR